MLTVQVAGILSGGEGGGRRGGGGLACITLVVCNEHVSRRVGGWGGGWVGGWVGGLVRERVSE